MTGTLTTTGITFTDFFCGFGGSSQGLTEAGLELVWAANHWDRAIETHAANFRDADHFQGDISGYDMRKVPRADVAWLSPECTWHSPAGGRKRVRAELDLFDDYVPDAAGERSRATMWDVVRAAEAKQFKVVIVENVVEVTSWPLFDSWLGSMTALGYEHQIVCVTAAHIGGELNPHAPQWRDRIYFVFYKRGIPMPRIEPRPLAWCAQCDGVVESVQSWKREDRRRIGKYGAQYVYVCASNQHTRHVVEPYVLPASVAIDWSDLGQVIGERDKDLAQATERRVKVGIQMFARPVVAAAAGQTYDAASEGQPRKFYRVAPADAAPLDPRMTSAGDAVASPPFVTNVRHGVDDHGRQFLPTEQPLPTAQTKIGDGVVVPAFLAVTNHGEGLERRVKSVKEPLPTRTTSGSEALVSPPFMIDGVNYQAEPSSVIDPADGAPLRPILANGRGHRQLVVPPHVTMLRANGKPTETDRDALATVTTGRNHGLTVPEGAEDAFIQKHHGGVDYPGVGHMVKSVDEPLPALVARVNTSLVIPYRRGSRAYQAAGRPLHTLSTHDSGALVQPPMFTDAELHEIYLASRFRMLGPREHLRAQRFPDSYVVKGNKSEQTKGAGNAVASNVAHWLGRFCVIALAGHVSKSERAA